jgi:hypothetical protein
MVTHDQLWVRTDSAPDVLKFIDVFLLKLPIPPLVVSKNSLIMCEAHTS